MEKFASIPPSPYKTFYNQLTKIFCLKLLNRLFINKYQRKTICIMQKNYSELTNALEMGG